MVARNSHHKKQKGNLQTLSQDYGGEVMLNYELDPVSLLVGILTGLILPWIIHQWMLIFGFKEK